MKKKNISVIIPCYNEQGVLVDTLSRLMLYKSHNLEIVVVDDGSKDNTYWIAKKVLKDYKNKKIIQLLQNKGKGYAVRTGLLNSKYKWKLILDADSSVDISELDSVIESDFNDYDSIIGVRNQVNPQPTYRILLGKIWQALVWSHTFIWMDTQCPFKLLHWPKEFYDKLKIDGFAYDVELLMIAKKHGFPWKKKLVDYYNKPDSKVTLKKVLRMFWDLLKIEN